MYYANAHYRHDNKYLETLTPSPRSLFASGDKSRLPRTAQQPLPQLADGSTKTRVPRVTSPLDLLVEICSGYEIPDSDTDLKKSDPYVTATFDGKEIHRTETIKGTTGPIWTLRKKSLFSFCVDPLVVSLLVFECLDENTVYADESLGAFSVSVGVLNNWNDGERREFKLTPLPGKKDYGTGTIALRVRRATINDRHFMDVYCNDTFVKDKQVDAITQAVAQRAFGFSNIVKKYKKGGKYRIRPGPDPKREDETKWLTDKQLQDEALTGSHKWHDIGSGNLGKIFVEVIGCSYLPNLDKFGILGTNKTDAFVSLVYEDCIARTDTIDDNLSPRWMPWTQRAFIFNIAHTSSQLFLGVFDHDRTSPHDLIGRVSVNVSNLKPNTAYVHHYNLHKSSRFLPRETDNGILTIRLRVELEDERTLLLSSLKIAPSVDVNMKNKKEYRVVRETVFGNKETNAFTAKNIITLRKELLSYKNDALKYLDLVNFSKDLFLWRGNFPVNIPTIDLFSKGFYYWKLVKLPVNSVIAFSAATGLVEHPELMPSFFFFCIGWFLFANGRHRSHNPNPWLRCKSFGYFVTALVHGYPALPPDEIKYNENKKVLDVLRSISEENEKKIQEEERKNAKGKKQAEKEYLATFHDGNSVILPAFLKRVQFYLQRACDVSVFVRNIIIWEECYFSFIMCLFSFILSAILYIIPLVFIVKWSMRIVAWTLFGPWMKLVDIYYFRKMDNKNPEEKLKRKKMRIGDKVMKSRIQNERVEKLRDFKQFMFGDSSTSVNVLKYDRYVDQPRSQSSATRYDPKLVLPAPHLHCSRIEGQQLVGDMIPVSMHKSIQPPQVKSKDD